MTSIGYVRTAPGGHDDAASQERDLRAAGCTVIYSDATDPFPNEGDGLRAALESTWDGDTFVVRDVETISCSTLQALLIIHEIVERRARPQILAGDPDIGTALGGFMIGQAAGYAEYRYAVAELHDDPSLKREREDRASAWIAAWERHRAEAFATATTAGESAAYAHRKKFHLLDHDGSPICGRVITAGATCRPLDVPVACRCLTGPCRDGWEFLAAFADGTWSRDMRFRPPPVRRELEVQRS